MWSELLNSDLGDQDLSMHSNGHEAGVTSLSNTESSIESWAAESLPSFWPKESMSICPESSITKDLTIESEGNASKLLCYGMVSHLH